MQFAASADRNPGTALYKQKQQFSQVNRPGRFKVSAAGAELSLAAKALLEGLLLQVEFISLFQTKRFLTEKKSIYCNEWVN